MTAPVRLESSVWTDPRYELLASFCGFADSDLARIKCARVWSYCTDRNDDVLSEQVIDALVRVPGFAAKMVDAELAERTRKGFRIRGAKGRIEWLNNKREAGSKGGKQSSSTRQAKAKHNSSTTQADLEQHSSSPPSTTQPSYSALTLALSPTLLCSEDEERARVRAPSPPPPTELPLEAEPDRVAASRAASWIATITTIPYSTTGNLVPALAEIGRKPSAERAAVETALRASEWAQKHPRRITPRHLVDHWHTYLAGEQPGKRNDKPDDAPRGDAYKVFTE